MRTFVAAAILISAGMSVQGFAIGQTVDPKQEALQKFAIARGKALRESDSVPATSAEWQQVRETLRANLIRAWGGFPVARCDLNAKTLGTIDRDGYRVERVVFQTMSDVWMTSNLYVPDSDADAATTKRPAVLCVHGHWSGAKQDPVVQSRCIGLVKLGFVVLCVDAFGAGERAVGKALGEYHGEMTGAMLLPIGRPLSGIQVWENMRAVDYLQSRPEVNPDRIGITGASGGGNQTMYAGGFDERLRCVVPTCSVGTYQAYLRAACCMCEVVPGGLKFTEEGDVLGLSAGRGLMVTSATKDAYQFSADQARISFARVSAIAGLTDGARVQHTIIESPHHYNQPMREAMYGWMTLHLKGEGDGAPIPEPAIQPEEPETLRCYPGDARPDDYMTIPKFSHREAMKLIEAYGRQDPLSAAGVAAARERLATVLGGPPVATPLNAVVTPSNVRQDIHIGFESEPGIRLTALLDSESQNVSKTTRLALLINTDAETAVTYRGDHANQLRSAGWRVAAVDLRGTGRYASLSDKIGQAPDHNTAEWSLWIGRPLLGQWVVDVRRAMDAISGVSGASPESLAVVGIGGGGLVAISTAALDERITDAIVVNSLSSWVSESPYRGQRLGLMVPGILKEVGDVSHITGLIAPRRVAIVGGVSGTGNDLTQDQLMQVYGPAVRAYAAGQVTPEIRIVHQDAFDSVLGNRR